MKNFLVVLCVTILLLLDVYLVAVIVKDRVHWKTYENKEIGFTLAYPENWGKAEDKGNSPSQGEISFEGAEGSVTIDWTSDTSTWIKYPNKCPKGEEVGGEQSLGWETLQINGETVKGCHLVYIGESYSMESWTATKLFPNTVFIVIVEEKGRTQVNRNLFMKVLSTLKFIK